MSVRTFTRPQSLNHALAMGEGLANGNSNADVDGQRSKEKAVEAADAIAKESMQPLASSKSQTKPGTTFAAQESLPKLPIPELEATCQRYLESLEPLQSSREHRETEMAVREFLRSEGPELQERLKKYATGKSSYIEQFCTCRMVTSVCEAQSNES